MSSETAHQHRRVYGVVFLFFCLIVGCVRTVAADSVSDFVRHTSRASNDSVLSILLGDDMTNAVTAARALGQRKDVFVGDILRTLFARAVGPRRDRDTLLLRLVLENVFIRPVPEPVAIRTNRQELTFLLGNLQSVSDAQTKRVLLEISRLLPLSDATEKPLLDEGRFLILYLRRTQGGFTPDRLAEATSFLSACAAHSNAVLRSQVATQIELARNALFVREARAYLAATSSLD